MLGACHGGVKRAAGGVLPGAGGVIYFGNAIDLCPGRG